MGTSGIILIGLGVAALAFIGWIGYAFTPLYGRKLKLQQEMRKTVPGFVVTMQDMKELRDCTHENPALQALHDSLFGWPVDPKTGKDLY